MIESDKDKLRLLIGDTEEGDPQLSDDEVLSLLSDRTVVSAAGTAVNITAAAADAADAIAARFSRDYDFAEDGQNFRRSQRAAAFRQLALSLRRRAGGQSLPLLSSMTAARRDNLHGG
jgi:hypothetical protein